MLRQANPEHPVKPKKQFCSRQAVEAEIAIEIAVKPNHKRLPHARMQLACKVVDYADKIRNNALARLAIESVCIRSG
jgi:hypothetical protein